jgi:two-component system, chemotaxis family, protein-glutamate methylesterase/glutaminase
MHTRDVVVIGGSLGAVDATRKLVSALPGDFPAAVLMVLHVGASGKNFLADIFHSQSALPVKTASDGDRIVRGCAYVAPADHHLLVIDETIRLGRGPRENLTRPAIDPTLRSAGVCYGPRAVGVILTGLLNDGASGLADLKRCGGIAVAQNPRDATASDMPLAALAAAEVDYRASLTELPELLSMLVAQPAEPKPPIPPEIGLEVQIALGNSLGSDVIRQIARPSTYSCPGCGGVLSEIERGPPLRFRCQVGHAYTGEAIMADGQGGADEAMLLALRILDERSHLAARMAQEARASERDAAARAFEQSAEQARSSAQAIRAAMAKQTA